MLNKKKSNSSSSMRSAKKGTRKTPTVKNVLEVSEQRSELITLPQGQSPSPLIEIYKTDEFKLAAANDIRFQVAREIIHLRRFRKASQGSIATLMGSSQSALARIEGASDNITIDTLERLVEALDGRLQISISPQELQISAPAPWWIERPVNANGWDWAQSSRTEDSLQAVIGIECKFPPPIQTQVNGTY